MNDGAGKYSCPKILIMDDSTSAVDAETEYHLQQALDQFDACAPDAAFGHRPQRRARGTSMVHPLRYSLLLLAIVAGAWWPAAFASVPTDIVLILDNSGSMKKNDPQFLAKDAVTQFVENEHMDNFIDRGVDDEDAAKQYNQGM